MKSRVIGGKSFNSGIRGGLWDKKHSDAMGEAVFLFGWFVHRQTKQLDGSGLVLGGHKLTYAEISADTGWPVRTLQRWNARLQRAGYIKVEKSLYSRMVIRVLNAKKFRPAAPKPIAQPKPSSPPKVAEICPPRLAQIATKSGGLNHRRVLGSYRKAEGQAAAASLKPKDSVWEFLKFHPCGPPEFQQLLETGWASRGSQRPSSVVGDSIDGWEALHGKLNAPSLFRALAELRRKERGQPTPAVVEEPIHKFTPEEIPA